MILWCASTCMQTAAQVRPGSAFTWTCKLQTGSRGCMHPLLIAWHPMLPGVSSSCDSPHHDAVGPFKNLPAASWHGPQMSHCKAFQPGINRLKFRGIKTREAWSGC